MRFIQKSFTHRSVSTFDRFPFQLTDELFLYGTALRGLRGVDVRGAAVSIRAVGPQGTSFVVVQRPDEPAADR